MESRKSLVSTLQTCRFCLTQGGNLSSLYDKTKTPKNAISLPLQIVSCVSVEVFPSDRMPSLICDRCRFFMDGFFKFKQICRQADEAILQFIHKDESIEPISWPQKLTKMFNACEVKKQSKPKASQERNLSNEEESEDDGNVYNIQIGEGADDDKETLIKVVKAGDKLHITQDGSKVKKKGFSSPTKLARHVRSHAGERPYLCKFCDKSFVKSHHYTRHMRVAHGAATSRRGPFGEGEAFSCEQCGAGFAAQDDLIYHSAKHAAESLTCPLCHERFSRVEDVSDHIKTHVEGSEFLCDLCELVFTSQEKLDKHFAEKHEDEMSNEQDIDDESLDVVPYEDPEDDEDDSENIQVKDAGDHMVVEIKKTNDFLKPSIIYEMAENAEFENSNSEEPPRPAPVAPTQNMSGNAILKRAEEIKRNLQKAESSVEVATKQDKPVKTETAANDKSLKLLEQELQELQRSTSQNETKTSARNADVLRNRRPPLHTSTPKPRPVEEKKAPSANKTPSVEKKLPERRPITKENKEPKESKDKDKESKDKESKDKEKEVKGNNNNNTKEDKEQKETAKAIVKNGNERPSIEENIRRSSRPSKVKDYAKLVKNKQTSDDDSDDDNDEEYKDTSGRSESRPRRKVALKSPAAPAPAPPSPAAPSSPPAETPLPRKRGRPRKDTSVHAKVKKVAEADTDGADTSMDTSKSDEKNKTIEEAEKGSTTPVASTVTEQKSGMIVSPTGQTLKKVPIKQLPPGVRPMPLPANARPIGNREVCEMQIGKKVVKVQKIVMTKTEVEAMAKKGLVEMKDGTIVLKQGIKLNTFDAASIKTSLAVAGATSPDPAIKTDKPAPTRCTISDD